MKCPRDVNPWVFNEMMECIPRGFVLKKSYLDGDRRHFVFLVKRKAKTPHEIPAGETFETACVLKKYR